MEENTAMHYEPKSCKDVYDTINTRQITALMFHDNMADLFNFLGLKGFEKMHEYQYLEESIGHRATKRHFIDRHGKLLPESHIESVEVIPSDWEQYTRMEVTPSVRKQYVQKALSMYKEWEQGTKDLYEACAGYLMDCHKADDFEWVSELVEDVSEELMCLEQLCVELSAVGYDCIYIMSIQGELCDKYHKRMKAMEGLLE